MWNLVSDAHQETAKRSRLASMDRSGAHAADWLNTGVIGNVRRLGGIEFFRGSRAIRNYRPAIFLSHPIPQYCNQKTTVGLRRAWLRLLEPRTGPRR
jgi:hypothetical protein